MTSLPISLLLVFISTLLITLITPISSEITVSGSSLNHEVVSDHYQQFTTNLGVVAGDEVTFTLDFVIPSAAEIDLASTVGSIVVLPIVLVGQNPVHSITLTWDNPIPGTIDIGGVVHSSLVFSKTYTLSTLNTYRLSTKFQTPYILPLSVEIRTSGQLFVFAGYTPFKQLGTSEEAIPVSIVPSREANYNIIPRTLDIILSGIVAYTTSTTSSSLGVSFQNTATHTVDQSAQGIMAWDNEGKPIISPSNFVLERLSSGWFFKNIPANAHTVRLRIVFPSTFPQHIEYSFCFRYGPTSTSFSLFEKSYLYIQPTSTSLTPLISITNVEHLAANELFPSSNGFNWPHDEIKYTFNVKRIGTGSQKVTLRPVQYLLNQLTFVDCASPIDVSLFTTNFDPSGIENWVVFTMNSGIEEIAMTCIAIPSPLFSKKVPRIGSKYEYLSLHVMTMSNPLASTPITSTAPPFLINSPDLITLFNSNTLKSFSMTARPHNYGLMDPQNKAQWDIILTLPGLISPSGVGEIAMKIDQLPTPVEIEPIHCKTTTWPSAFGPRSSQQLSIIPISLSDTHLNTYTFELNPSTTMNAGMQCWFQSSATIHHYPTLTDNTFYYYPPSNTVGINNMIADVNIKMNGNPTQFEAPLLRPGHVFDTTLEIAKTFNPTKAPIPLTTSDIIIPFELKLQPTVHFQPSVDSMNDHLANSIWKTQPDGIVFDSTKITLFITSPATNIVSSAPPKWGLSPDTSRWKLTADKTTTSNGFAFITNPQGKGDFTITQETTFPFQLSYSRSSIDDIVLTLNIGSELAIAGPMVGDKIDTVTDLLSPSTIQYVIPLEPTKQLLGTASLKITGGPSTDIIISRLVDIGGTQPSSKQLIELSQTTKVSITFTPYKTGFPVQKVELWYLSSSGQEVRLKSFDTASTTVELSFNSGTRGYNNAFFKFTYPYPGTTEVYTIPSEYFDILPRCQSLSASGILTVNCLANEICIPTTGLCQAYAITPDAPVSPAKCPKCDQDNTQSCTAQQGNTASICTCKSGWTGLSCQQSTQCNTKSKCNLDNGYTTLTTESGQCSTTCTCYNEWSGMNCQTCQLQCQNSGIAYKDCARCGCESGYTGSNCQCKAVSGNIIIKGANELLIANRGKLSTNNDDDELIFDQNALDNKNQLLTNLSTNNDIIHMLTLQDLYKSFRKPLTNSDTGVFGMSMKPIMVDGGEQSTQTHGTKFTFYINYDCSDYNPQITSLDQLSSLWSLFVQSLHTNEQILQHFSFVNAEAAEIEGDDLVPTSPSLPSDEDRLINTSSNTTLFSVFTIVTLALFTFYC